MGLPPFAEAICDAGVAVLLYDHRGLGASDGDVGVAADHLGTPVIIRIRPGAGSVVGRSKIALRIPARPRGPQNGSPCTWSAYFLMI